MRDLIAFPSDDPEQLFAVYHSRVEAWNLRRTSTSYVLRDLSFAPTCMTTGLGYLAVGGQRSQVVVRSLGNDWYHPAWVR